MNPWVVAVLIAVLFVLGSALYIRLRWRRSPRAYRAMVVVAACYLLAGSLLGAWVLHLAAPKRAEVMEQARAVGIPSIPASGFQANGDNVHGRAAPNNFSAKVVSITDGDTVDVLGPGGLTSAVRLAGIDAPEHGQPFGTESTQRLSEIISGKTVNMQGGWCWAHGEAMI